MSMISKERRDAIRVYIARSRSAGQTTGVFMVDDIGALLDALDAAEKAEPVAWMVRGHLRDGTAVLRLPVLTSREDADRYAACNPDYTLAPLYTHPAPAVREGWKLTAYEAQVLIGTTISGCNMPPDRTFDLSAAWAQLRKLGLIDRVDGLAHATDKGASLVAAMLAAAPEAK